MKKSIDNCQKISLIANRQVVSLDIQGYGDEYDLVPEQQALINWVSKLAVADRRSPGEVLLWNMEGFQKKGPMEMIHRAKDPLFGL